MGEAEIVGADLHRNGFETEGAEIGYDCREPMPAAVRRVLDDDVLGAALFDKASHFAPEAALGSVEPRASSGVADVLAWEPAADEADIGRAVGNKSVCREGSNVVMAGHLGPALGKDGSGELFDLAESDSLETGAL
jgi:hypothetical protein